jgi:hypothetical protein
VNLVRLIRGLERVAATDTLLGTKGEVRGHVRAANGSEVTNCFVFLYNKKTDTFLSSAGFFVNADGGYRVPRVPPGKWKAYCRPNPALPLVSQTYSRRTGFDPAHGTPIDVQAGTITRGIDFLLPPAGKLQVLVTGPDGTPIPGVVILLYPKSSNFLTQLPTVTDENGLALFANVPLRSRIFLKAPAGFASTWWDGKADRASGDVIRIAAAGAGVLIVSVLPRAG